LAAGKAGRGVCARLHRVRKPGPHELQKHPRSEAPCSVEHLGPVREATLQDHRILLRQYSSHSEFRASSSMIGSTRDRSQRRCRPPRGGVEVGMESATIDYQRLVAEAGTADYDRLVEHLSTWLPHDWRDAYETVTPRPTNIRVMSPGE